MIEDIYNYKEISPLISTAGQPDECELHEIGKDKFEVVINLGLEDTEYSISNEANILATYDIKYIHIPVNFQKPEAEQFNFFSKVLSLEFDKKIFIHCAANKRVSVFITLYQVVKMNMKLKDVESNILSIWEPNDIWKNFISVILESK